jgi:hypothetical protein
MRYLYREQVRTSTIFAAEHDEVMAVGAHAVRGAERGHLRQNRTPAAAPPGRAPQRNQRPDDASVVLEQLGESADAVQRVTGDLAAEGQSHATAGEQARTCASLPHASGGSA